MSHRKSLKLHEIEDELEQWDDAQDVYIEPPEVAEYTDEDSADEDSGGFIDNLTGRQLLATAEIVTRRTSFEETEDEVTAHGPAKKRKVSYKWKKADLPDLPSTEFETTISQDYEGKTCTDMFELFFDEGVCQFLIDQTTKYALFLNCPDPRINIAELKCFFAILIVSGYNKLPSKKSYWETGDDMRNSLVSNAMRRDKFIQIMRFVHASDNTQLNKNDRMSKLRPLMNVLKNKFLEHIPIEQDLNYDESMIEYYGRHGCKQCIRNKPIRFGYKAWCLNSVSGYLANFEVYQGSIPGSNLEHEQKFGKATAPMLTMINELPLAMRTQKLRFYFDNLFTGIPLLMHLKKMGYGGTGTLRQNRLPKECPIAKVETMKKRERGSYEYASQGDVVVARWMDNSVVTVASTDHKVHPLGTASRYSKACKQKIKIPRPHLIGAYNQSMGGTDLMDAHINNYRIGIRSKKWWWPIFTWLIDVSVNNSWILMRKSGRNISQLDFRREIAQTYLKKYANPPKAGGRPSTSQFGGRILEGVRREKYATVKVTATKWVGGG
ncbi:piggyBac transposable element-derived protein 3-like [Anastrepha obliqua]|uniref:piggyBac transposable element-derived protein 3-like n=1 Tax=Anastrepha obliqua TaxID=95512 RepID=UPI002409D33F|nr:piggyBac transposable element-derived protein 3-like [Anastrepha obliqua]